MNEQIVAVPSCRPGGLKAPRSNHFGRADCFTVIDTSSRLPKVVSVIENAGPDGGGGCTRCLAALIDLGVGTVLAAGLGQRPLQMLADAGVAVRFCDGETVGEMVSAHVSGRSAPVGDEQVCGRGQGHRHRHTSGHGQGGGGGGANFPRVM